MSHRRLHTVFIGGLDPAVPNLIGWDAAGAEVSLLMASGWARPPARLVVHAHLRMCGAALDYVASEGMPHEEVAAGGGTG